VPSPKVPTYDLQPEMSAKGITDTLVSDVESRRHDVIICNFANADMVGHTGKIDAVVRAVETIDRCLARIVQAVRQAGGTIIVTADHGNAEEMWNQELNEPHTAHTCNPVPIIVVGDMNGRRLRAGGSLRDVAPTMIGLLGVEKPQEMTGEDLRISEGGTGLGIGDWDWDLAIRPLPSSPSAAILMSEEPSIVGGHVERRQATTLADRDLDQRATFSKALVRLTKPRPPRA
jgi:hypothetical protein